MPVVWAGERPQGPPLQIRGCGTPLILLKRAARARALVIFAARRSTTVSRCAASRNWPTPHGRGFENGCPVDSRENSALPLKRQCSRSNPKVTVLLFASHSRGLYSGVADRGEPRE